MLNKQRFLQVPVKPLHLDLNQVHPLQGTLLVQTRRLHLRPVVEELPVCLRKMMLDEDHSKSRALTAGVPGAMGPTGETQAQIKLTIR